MKKENNKKGVLVEIMFIVIFIAAWELLSKMNIFGRNSQIVFPPVEDIVKAFIDNFNKGYAGLSLWIYIANSMKLLLKGLIIGILLSFVFSSLAIFNNVFKRIFNLLVSICDLLPGIALLPVVIIIFGVNEGVIVLLVVHSVIWPMSRNLLDGFANISNIYIEVGKNIGLSGRKLLTGVYLPATSSYIVSGLKVGWARAWRGLISAEMIFGLASCPGIGLYINQMRTNLNNAEVYATLLVIIIIGLFVQYGILEIIEKKTIVKWGMTK